MRMDTDISKKCTECGKEIWPQLATAVIVLIHRGDEVLLVRAKNFRRDFFGLVAGFVETGETLEEAVAREALVGPEAGDLHRPPFRIVQFRRGPAPAKALIAAVRAGDFPHVQQNTHHLLHLLLVCAAIAGDGLLDLPRGVFVQIVRILRGGDTRGSAGGAQRADIRNLSGMGHRGDIQRGRQGDTRPAEL